MKLFLVAWLQKKKFRGRRNSIRSVFSRHRLMPLDCHLRWNNKQNTIYDLLGLFIIFSYLSLWAVHAQKQSRCPSMYAFAGRYILCTILDSPWACIKASMFSSLPFFSRSISLFLFFLPLYKLLSFLRKFMIILLRKREVRVGNRCRKWLVSSYF